MGTDHAASNQIVYNSLKSVLILDDDNQTKVLHENIDGDIRYGEEVDDDNNAASYNLDIFDIRMYERLYRSDYTYGVTTQSDPETLGQDCDAQRNNNNCSTNFGSLVYSDGKTYYIKSELVNGNYYLYILVNNKKYYVVFYEKDGSNPVVDNFTFDRTFLYYNIKDRL